MTGHRRWGEVRRKSEPAQVATHRAAMARRYRRWWWRLVRAIDRLRTR